MLKEPFKSALPIIDLLNKNGYECYFVGGAVRDYLLNRPIGDVDLATSATPEKVMQLFKRTVPTGLKHGTVLVILNSGQYEVTTYRTEGKYEDRRRPEKVHFVTDIKEDLARRDFTMNAMAMGKDGRIIDPYDGKADLENQQIKTVGVADERFNEDALRMLRAIRFSSQLNFKIDDTVIQAIQNHRELLEFISVERITVELEKLLTGEALELGLHYLRETQVYEKLPIFNEHPKLFDSFHKLKISSMESLSVWIALLHTLDRSIDISTWVRAYKLSNNIRTNANMLVDCYDRYVEEGISNQLLFKLTDKHLSLFINLLQCNNKPAPDLKDLKEAYEALPIKKQSDLAISGADLQRLFPNRKKGKWIGESLNHLCEAVLKLELPNDIDRLEDQVIKWNQTKND